MCREARGREAAGYRLDVADRARMQALAAQVAADHGDVDIVVNNAGVPWPHRQRLLRARLHVRQNPARLHHHEGGGADAVVRAIEHDRSVVPVGHEAWLGWWFNRYLPIRTHQAFGKLPLT